MRVVSCGNSGGRGGGEHASLGDDMMDTKMRMQCSAWNHILSVNKVLPTCNFNYFFNLLCIDDMV